MAGLMNKISAALHGGAQQSGASTNANLVSVEIDVNNLQIQQPHLGNFLNNVNAFRPYIAATINDNASSRVKTSVLDHRRLGLNLASAPLNFQDKIVINVDPTAGNQAFFLEVWDDNTLTRDTLLCKSGPLPLQQLMQQPQGFRQEVTFFPVGEKSATGASNVTGGGGYGGQASYGGAPQAGMTQAGVAGGVPQAGYGQAGVPQAGMAGGVPQAGYGQAGVPQAGMAGGVPQSGFAGQQAAYARGIVEMRLLPSGHQAFAQQGVGQQQGLAQPGAYQQGGIPQQQGIAQGGIPQQQGGMMAQDPSKFGGGQAGQVGGVQQFGQAPAPVLGGTSAPGSSYAEGRNIGTNY